MANDEGCRQGPRVAFTAKMKIDDSYPKSSGVLKFADVVINEGGGYNPDTGIFTCPVRGFYNFIVHMTVYGKGQCAIFKNGEKVVSMSHVNHPDQLSYNSSQVASMSGLVKLYEKDDVWVNLNGQGQLDIFATEDNETSFTGFYVM
ncbi:complement C1q and tumor necrosis factor-related protein 9-like [Antennarius striatus]|uniref:complement C1q and tumor necrosis factor-related protein 9-like n=1 Tax=Antennarius striatus TaxID=241820 RepID=UPI0035B07056